MGYLANVSPPTFLEALRFWTWLGFVSFGGPAGQIATLHREVVQKKRWIAEGRFTHALAYCTLLPGPEAQQLVTYVGWLLHGTLGGVVAGSLFVLPGLFVMIGLSAAYFTWGSVGPVAAAFAGVKPAVVAVVALAAWRVARRSLAGWPERLLALGALIAVLLDVPFPYLVGAALLLGTRLPARGPAAHGKPASTPADPSGEPVSFVLGDEDPPPPHAVPQARRLATTLAVGLALGVGTLRLLPAGLATMARFFTSAAFLTFGGAYAVLPYVHDGAVAHQWATSAQVVDGLALGETTPGPLILIVSFVGYAGAGVAGAVVATFFTFLPSFCFILLGAPFVERARTLPKLRGPMTAVSAAVVGVILHLALRLGGNALFPDGRFDPVAVVVALVAGALLFRERVGIVGVLLGAAMVGLGRSLLSI